MCAFGMLQEDEHGVGLVKKPTGFMTNSRCIADRLKRPCEGGHRHIHLINGRAKRAEVYPDELCYEILQGLIEQMKLDKRLLGNGCLGSVGSTDEDKIDWSDYSQHWDDVTGKELKPDLVHEARREEMEE